MVHVLHGKIKKGKTKVVFLTSLQHIGRITPQTRDPPQSECLMEDNNLSLCLDVLSGISPLHIQIKVVVGVIGIT